MLRLSDGIRQLEFSCSRNVYATWLFAFRVLCLVALCALLVPAMALCQQSATLPRFDVVSVKRMEQPGLLRIRTDPARVEFHNITMKNLILRAFGVADYQAMLPAWTASAQYDVVATMPSSTPPQAVELMVQDMLTDRFGLSAHNETRDAKVYTLGISSRGLKIRRAVNPPDADSPVIGPMQGPSGWHLTSKYPKEISEVMKGKSGYTIAQLVQFCARRLDRPLLDQTGLEGYFDIDLEVSRDLTPQGSEADSGAAPVGSVGLSDAALFAALESQLGLKVEKKTVPLRMLVVDHLDQTPTSN